MRFGWIAYSSHRSSSGPQSQSKLLCPFQCPTGPAVGTKWIPTWTWKQKEWCWSHSSAACARRPVQRLAETRVRSESGVWMQVKRWKRWSPPLSLLWRRWRWPIVAEDTRDACRDGRGESLPHTRRQIKWCRENLNFLSFNSLLLLLLLLASHLHVAEGKDV